MVYSRTGIVALHKRRKHSKMNLPSNLLARCADAT